MMRGIESVSNSEPRQGRTRATGRIAAVFSRSRSRTSRLFGTSRCSVVMTPPWGKSLMSTRGRGACARRGRLGLRAVRRGQRAQEAVHRGHVGHPARRAAAAVAGAHADGDGLAAKSLEGALVRLVVTDVHHGGIERVLTRPAVADPQRTLALVPGHVRHQLEHLLAWTRGEMRGVVLPRLLDLEEYLGEIGGIRAPVVHRHAVFLRLDLDAAQPTETLDELGGEPGQHL